MIQEVARLFSILSFLSPHSQVRSGELAVELGVAEAQIAEDLAQLARLPIGLDGDSGEYRVSPRGYQNIMSVVRPVGAQP